MVSHVPPSKLEGDEPHIFRNSRATLFHPMGLRYARRLGSDGWEWSTVSILEAAREAGPGPGPAPVGAAGGPRVVRRRPGLPTGRAVVGGLLVALAAVGTFAAATTGGDGREPVVVAARALAPGEVVGPGDLTTARFALPDGTEGFADPASLVGAVLVGPLDAGDLVQRADVVAAPGEAGGAEVSVSVPEARALGGAIARGERVDIVATTGSGADACTARVAAGALVVRVDTGTDGLGAVDAVVLRLAVPTADDALALAHAAQAGDLTVVRTTGGSPPSGEGGAAAVDPATGVVTPVGADDHPLGCSTAAAAVGTVVTDTAVGAG
jgi:hypothetical protein